VSELTESNTARGETGATGESDSETLIDAVNELTKANARLAEVQQALISAVTRDAALRTEKIQAIEQTNTQISKALIALVAVFIALTALAIVNAVNLNRTVSISRDARQTNELLVGCVTPGSECQRQTQVAQQTQLNEIRLTSLVIAQCQRSHPIAVDPDGAKMIACVQDYYPDLVPPQKARR
jgi:hypothetical protein